jgi:hypothetical protein
MINDNLNMLSFTNSRLILKKKCKIGSVGDRCQIMSPNWPIIMYNTGFIAKNIVNDEYFQLSENISPLGQRISEENDFVILKADQFEEFFSVEEDNIITDQ